MAKILGELSQHTHSAPISFDMLGASSIIQAYRRYTTDNDFPQTNAPSRPTIVRPFQGLTVCCMMMVLRPFWKTLSLYKANHLKKFTQSTIHTQLGLQGARCLPVDYLNPLDTATSISSRTTTRINSHPDHSALLNRDQQHFRAPTLCQKINKEMRKMFLTVCRFSSMKRMRSQRTP